jgi:hypothetical protein
LGPPLGEAIIVASPVLVRPPPHSQSAGYPFFVLSISIFFIKINLLKYFP